MFTMFGLEVSYIISYYRHFHVILSTRSSQGLHSLLEKSLNFSGSSLKVLKFLCKSLKSSCISFSIERNNVKSVFYCFLVFQEKLYYKAFFEHFYAISNYQFKTSVLKNVGQVQALKSC